MIPENRRLHDYTPTPYMAPGSRYDKQKADHAVRFITSLRHTKGKWKNKHFELIDWQEKIIRDLFGTVKENGFRQFHFAYIEIAKKQGKSELGAAIALLLLCGDGEQSAEIYSCACDKEQASIVFNVARDMVRACPALNKRCKINESRKTITFLPTMSVYKVLSAESKTKHGLNVSGCVFDELHAQPDRKLYDVMTSGSGDAREQPLFFLITTAGDNIHSICYEQHQKAQGIIDGRIHDPLFYPAIFGIPMEADWTDERNWIQANPSLGITIDLETVRAACNSAKQNPAEENAFRQLRLNQWVKQTVRWMPMLKWNACDTPVVPKELQGRVCFGGLDLSSTGDITVFVLVFPPTEEDGVYYVLPFFWIPEECLDLRVRRDHVPYDIWRQKGLLDVTEGNVIHYGYIEKRIEELNQVFNIKEICFDRWGATQMSQNLDYAGFKVIPFGQGFRDMSPPTKELYNLVLSGRIAHGGNEVMSWMMENVVVRKDPAGNIKIDKEKSPEKVDGPVALVMALDRALRYDGIDGNEIEERGFVCV